MDYSKPTQTYTNLHKQQPIKTLSDYKVIYNTISGESKSQPYSADLYISVVDCPTYRQFYFISSLILI
jgi:hypothetical protein